MREARTMKLSDQTLSMLGLPHNKRSEDLWIPLSYQHESIPYEGDEVEEKKKDQLFSSMACRQGKPGEDMDLMRSMGKKHAQRGCSRPRAESRHARANNTRGCAERLIDVNRLTCK